MGKKTFSENLNPAMPFISSAPAEADTPAEPDLRQQAPEGYKLNPLYIEKRSKRVQLVIQPSVYEAAKAEADKLGISFNEYAHRAIENELAHKEG